MASKSPTGATPMSISVMMVMCLAMKDGTKECNVSGRYLQPDAYSVDDCTNAADSAINDALLESRKVGWAKGICFPQDKYSQVVTRAVEYLESKGYKVNFKAYTGE